MYHQTVTGSAEPSAYIAVNRNRLKHYGEKVYLKDGTNFEIEIFNPKPIKILARIYLNNKPISSSGIVIRPGQRVFLERWIDEAKKFLFETYSIEDSIEAKEAIVENGKVRVEFYDETTLTGPFGYGPITYFAGSYLTDSWTSSSPSFGGTTVNTAYQFNCNIGANASTPSVGSLETGRAEKGDSSNQQFSSDSSSYSTWINKRIDLQILPESQKPHEIQNIRNYCHNCGSRMKNQNWKFCPTCGTKF